MSVSDIIGAVARILLFSLLAFACAAGSIESLGMVLETGSWVWASCLGVNCVGAIMFSCFAVNAHKY